MTLDDDRAVRCVVDVDGVPMSALVRDVADPRAVIVALHGGGATARYFHHPGQPRSSLLNAGAALGFTVVALDRPGYGGSGPDGAHLASPRRRTELAYGALERLLGTGGRGAGLFVLAHSAGCELALRMAGDGHGWNLLGLELSGTGLRYHPLAEDILGNGEPGKRPSGLRSLLWHPPRLYPGGVALGLRFAGASPGYEGEVVAHWTERDFPALAARVRVPVHFTVADHEVIWRNDAGAVAALFTASPRVVTHEMTESGHNLSVGRSALAYHLRILSFVEECVLAGQG
ncbi:alpha/beta hydrolase [Amycolatopsis sp. K13G38]|uniref:Alpha/beta hydrolase n=2 Tax=Amycolatopsis acididurans TaxID=2724524 RepID=A0ABX1IVM2_9PSEU|nr:alpha/beta hydrolase [Amycolatopsis acididurans]